MQNQMPPMQRNSFANIKIIKLICQETGTYNPQFLRPYETYVDQNSINTIADRVNRANSDTCTPYLFSGIASNILTPSATAQQQVPIPQGWNERRIRFILEVEVTGNLGITHIDYYQGYTNYLGISNAGNIDPNMDFIINSVTRVKRASIRTPYGMEIRDTISDSANILNGEIYSTISPSVYSMRPQDVFSGIQSNYLKQGYDGNNQVYDTRIQFGNSNIASNRNNNISSNFISSVIEGFKHSQNLAMFGQDDTQIIDRARQTVMAEDSDIDTNIFLRKLASVKGYGSPTNFNMKDLLAIDPGAASNTHFVALGQTAKMNLHQAGQTSFWNGSDRETQIATILSNAVPAIMMECLFSKVGFKSTNSDMSGKANTVFYDGKSLTNADLTTSYQVFKKRLETEILFDITYGNQDTYMLDMYVDMFGETKIALSIGGNPMTCFTTPSFCDSLVTPVFTLNTDSFYKLSHDFESIINNIGESNVSTRTVNSLV
jgi:hypothetical protein